MRIKKIFAKCSPNTRPRAIQGSAIVVSMNIAREVVRGGNAI